jgi:hypothetical protein
MLFKIYDYPAYVFWLISLLLIIPNVIYDIYTFATIQDYYNPETLENSFSYAVLRVPNNENQQIICQVNTRIHSSRILDIIFFEVIIAITLAFNTAIYAYSTYKIRAKSPSSVVERMMKKSAGYILVQFIVWVPVFISNVVHLESDTPTGLQKGFKVLNAMNCLQGFLNCIIYIYTDRMFRKWINKAIDSIRNSKSSDIKSVEESNNTNMEIGLRESFSTLTDTEIGSDNSNSNNINMVKSILHTRRSNVDFENKKFVKFKSKPEVRYIGETRLTEQLIRIETEEKNLRLSEKNY